jgi:hypothetical protein
MDHEKIDSIVYFMNLAERMIGKDNSIAKKNMWLKK